MTNQETPMSAEDFGQCLIIDYYIQNLSQNGRYDLYETISDRDQQLTAAKDAEIAALQEVINMKDRLREELQAQLAKMREALNDIAMCNMPRRCLDCHANARNALTEPTQGESK